MIYPFAHKCAQPQTSTRFHPPSKDPYEPSISDDSIDLVLQINFGLDSKDNSDNDKNETANGINFTRAQKGALNAGKNAKAANKRATVE